MSHIRPRLEELAALFGIERSFHDIRGKEYVASDEALFSLLPRLGARLHSESSLDEALRHRRVELAERVLEPVLVAWDGELAPIEVSVPRERREGRFRVSLTLESGEVNWGEGVLGELEVVGSQEVDGRRFERVRIPAPAQLPLGYHRLELELGTNHHAAMVIAAPRQAYLPENPRLWGVFAPAYALWQRDRLGGSLRELGALVQRVGELGGQVVGTLPLMAAFLKDEPFEPSPYAPVSRLFWNELFLDVEALPELAETPVVAERLASEELRREADALQRERLVDYRRLAALKRALVEPLVDTAFREGSASRAALLDFAARNPRADDYARFRAVSERQRRGWPAWPEALQRGEFGEDALDPASYRYHLYAQVRMDAQLDALATRARALGAGLYLDLPLGVHPDGYDAWREAPSFFDGCSAGAPPDDLFVGGQDWGFRPLHPERIRERGYRYVIDCVRHQLRCAGALRVDHVMGLHRLYCVPWGLGAKQGVYVRYRPEELYAILTLESQRHRSFLVGEDLGTVPAGVRTAMAEHRFQRMYVMQFELRHDPHRAIMPVPDEAIASVNTHDTPSFAGFWEGSEIEDRLRLGHLPAEEAPAERDSRAALREHVLRWLRDQRLLGDGPARTADVLRAGLEYLGASDARLVLANLEDLFEERHPQNVPGTTNEHPNWRQKTAAPLEALSEDERAVSTLHALAEARRRGRGA
jgi:4-alpha-glucanotransferase